MVIYCFEFLTYPQWFSWITMTPRQIPSNNPIWSNFLCLSLFLLTDIIRNNRHIANNACTYSLIMTHLFHIYWYLIWKLWIIHLTLTWYFLIGRADLDFLFHMFFLARYCKLLEENSFRGRTADFFYMLLFGATVLTGIVLLGGMIPYLSESFAKIIFLSNSLTFMMVSHISLYFCCWSFLVVVVVYCWVLLFNSVANFKASVYLFQVYVWSKQNPFIHMSFLGLFTFTAAYLPWVCKRFGCYLIG